MPAPPDPIDNAAGSVGTVPAQPVIAHQQSVAWTYLLVAAVAVAITLAVVLLVARLRQASSGKQTSPSPEAA
jgi:hypothetical protein